MKWWALIWCDIVGIGLGQDININIQWHVLSFAKSAWVLRSGPPFGWPGGMRERWEDLPHLGWESTVGNPAGNVLCSTLVCSGTIAYGQITDAVCHRARTMSSSRVLLRRSSPSAMLCIPTSRPSYEPWLRKRCSQEFSTRWKAGNRCICIFLYSYCFLQFRKAGAVQVWRVFCEDFSFVLGSWDLHL